MVFQIIRHAFRMIFGNLGQALRVSVGPYLILITVAVVVFTSTGLGQSMSGMGRGAGGQMGPSGALVVLLLVLLALFVFGWVAVAWHRFILLEEYTGVLPAIAERPIWSYVGRSMVYVFLMILIAIPILFLAGLLAGPMMTAGPGGALFVFLLTATAASYFWFRMAVALPAIAVGKPISIGTAWSASGPMRGTILGISLALVVISALAGIIVNQVTALLPLVGFVLDVIVQWVTLMLGISILTTLYGHLIEGRPLID